MELRTINKIKIEKIELVENGLELTTITNSKCLIPLEQETINDLSKNIFNLFKPKPFIWDFTRNLIKEFNDVEYVIDYEIAGDYFGYAIINGKLNPLRFSDAYLILSGDNNFYINAELIPVQERNLQYELQKAVEEENFILAEELKKLISEKRI